MFFGNYSFIKDEESEHNKLFNVNISKFIGVFNAIYETRSLKEAGKITLRTKSSMSKSLKQLEYILGGKLFNRNGKNGLSVTEFGERFFFIQNNSKL